MKILLISPAMPPHSAGEAEYAAQLVQQLHARGHQVTVLTNPGLGRGASAELLRPLPLLKHQVAGWRWGGLPSLLATLHQTQADAVILIYTNWLFDDHSMVSFLPTWLKLVGRNARVLTLFQLEDGAAPKSLPDRVLTKLVARLSQAIGIPCVYGYGALLTAPSVVAALGPAILQGLQGKAPVGMQGLLIPPPPLLSGGAAPSADERQRIRSTMGVPGHSLLLAYFGYVYPGKGVETLLAALQTLARQGRDVHLCMVGGGRSMANGAPSHHAFEQQMVALAEQLGVADRVHWLAGYASGNHDAAHVLAAADMAVLPFDDGAEMRRSSLAVVSAAGLPIVTTQPQQAESDAFRHEDNVLLCPPQDVAALTQAIALVADDRALRQRLHEGALELSRTCFSWQQAMDLITQSLSATSAAV
jgi:glycosyltransferase involved in cell wall biosynthesis